MWLSLLETGKAVGIFVFFLGGAIALHHFMSGGKAFLFCILKGVSDKYIDDKVEKILCSTFDPLKKLDWTKK